MLFKPNESNYKTQSTSERERVSDETSAQSGIFPQSHVTDQKLAGSIAFCPCLEAVGLP